MPRRPTARALLAGLAWAALLALLPWWLGLPLLLALAAALPLLLPRLAPMDALRLSHALGWGLAGLLFALQRALGGDAWASCLALLAALVGYTLLAGLQAWLGRSPARPAAGDSTPAWPELALAPIGPAARIIELQLPQWQSADADPHPGGVHYVHGGYRFDDGLQLDDVAMPVACSEDGRWFVARRSDGCGIVLCDRQRGQLHRLRGWQLCGWYRDQPWLSRDDDALPLPLSAVLGQDASSDRAAVEA